MSNKKGCPVYFWNSETRNYIFSQKAQSTDRDQDQRMDKDQHLIFSFVFIIFVLHVLEVFWNMLLFSFDLIC